MSAPETSTAQAPISPAPSRGAGRRGGSVRRVLAVATRIIRQFLHDRRSLALLFVAPLVVMTILNLVLNNTTAGVTLGIVPPDEPLGSALVSQIKDHAKDQSGLTIITVARDQADATLTAGNADGVLVFPADLATELATNQTPTIRLELEGSDPLAAKQLRSLTTLLIASLGQSAAPGSAPTAAGGFLPIPQPMVKTEYLYGGPEYTETDALAPLFIGLFALFFVFLLTSVSFLRERSQGTIERLLVSPLRKTELVLGYVFGFLLFALAQSLVILLFVIYVLQVHYKGNLGLLFLVTVALTVVGVNMGIFASAFARNELQVVQFIPLLLVPQALLGGLFFPVATLPVVLKQIAYALPLTYANFALKDVMLKGFGFDQIWPELAILVGFAALMVVLAAVSLRQDRV